MLRIGLAGCTVAAKCHARVLRALSREGKVEVLGLAEPNGQRARLGCTHLRMGSSFSSVQQLLDSVKLDGLVVTSPPSAHLEAWKAALEKDVAVFMEKPFLVPGQFCASSSQAENGARMMFDLNRRFWGTYQKLRSSIAASGGATGGVVTLRVAPKGWLPVSDYRTRPGEGGALFDLGVHAFDLARFLSDDEVESVAACRRLMKEEAYEVDLKLIRSGKWKCQIAYAGRPTEKVVVTTRSGMWILEHPFLQPHLGRVSAMVRWGGAIGSVMRHVAAGRRSLVVHTIDRALRSFVDTIEGGGDFEPGYRDAIRLAEWLENAHEMEIPVPQGS